jgi:hypothetical protein
MSAAAPNPSVAQIESILADLILERQRLRRDNADKPLLEANRLAIVYWQQELTRVLGDEHRGAA